MHVHTHTHTHTIPQHYNKTGENSHDIHKLSLIENKSWHPVIVKLITAVLLCRNHTPSFNSKMLFISLLQSDKSIVHTVRVKLTITTIASQ